MNEQQLTLTRLLGKKELSFWCKVKYIGHNEKFLGDYIGSFVSDFSNENCAYIFDGYKVHNMGGIEKHMEIIWHPATLSDLHRWMNESNFNWSQVREEIQVYKTYEAGKIKYIPYESSKCLLEQSSETLERIINLISNNP